MARKVPLLNKQGNAILTNQEIVSQKFHYFREGVKRLVIEMELADFIGFFWYICLLNSAIVSTSSRTFIP